MTSPKARYRMGVQIRPMTSQDAAAVLAICQAGIDEGDATSETQAPAGERFTAARLPAHRYVATAGGDVAGWVAASSVSDRCVYAGVIESTPSTYTRRHGARASGASSWMP
jgi:L-amino acid N-acyltransferase YncA